MYLLLIKHQIFFSITLSYGTTNQAFDPTPEQDIHHGQLRTIHDSDGKSRSSFDSLDTEEEEGSMTPRAIDQEELYFNKTFVIWIKNDFGQEASH